MVLHSLITNIYSIFAPAKSQHGQVSYGQLPRNPPGWEHSKGTWL